MKPTIKYCIESVSNGQWKAQDLREYSMMAKGGAYLAPFHEFEKKLPAEVIAEVMSLEAKIKSGEFIVPIVETRPLSD
jgi:basic membrane lipoprotein Med (substrate-binding protein (PBP1-ABC) superfamily)